MASPFSGMASASGAGAGASANASVQDRSKGKGSSSGGSDELGPLKESVNRSSSGGSSSGSVSSIHSNAAAASALAIPSPSHLSVASNITPGGLSPIARHSRGAFDSTPSFSSPLAYASTLPIDQADDFEIDSCAIAEDDETASRKSDTSRNSDTSIIVNPASTSTNKIRKTSSSMIKQAIPQSADIYYSTDEEIQGSLLDTPTLSASARRERSTSARARLLAWDKQDAAAIQSRSSLSSIRPEGITHHPRRKSNAPSTLMGPPLTIPRKSSTTLGALLIGSGRNEPEGLRRSISGRVLSGMSDDSQRSVSTASIASTDSGSPSSLSWHNSDSVPEGGQKSNRHAPPTPSPVMEKSIPSRRLRANTHASISSAHRRAKSLGGSLLSEAASPIGGPDGVDPDLVAAIRAGDSSIPSPLAALETSISRMSLGGDSNYYNTQGISPTSRIASLPSTPQSSIRQTSASRRPVDHLSIIPDARALASSYPSLQIPRNDQSTGNDTDHVSPTDLSGMNPSSAIPPDYSRSRVRSQTMSPGSLEAGLTSSSSTMSTSFNPKSPITSFASRANAPLGDAIRLQKVPSNIRLTGDYNTRTEASTRLHPSQLQLSSSASDVPGSHGLGIGMSTSPDNRLPVPPQTPSVTRNPSPQTGNENVSVSSNSERTSPALFQGKRDQSNPLFQSVGDPSPLTVSIPLFNSQDANLETLSALPALNYKSALSSPSSGRDSATMGPPLSAVSNIGPFSVSQSAFAPLLAMPSPQFERPRGPRGSIFFDEEEGERNESITRPAPWIASSQEVRRGSSNSTLKAALTQRTRASMSNTGGSGQFEVQRLGRVNSNSKSGNRRISAAPAPQGIDEYARIIVQSRNAKMQKWRPASRQQSPNPAEQSGASVTNLKRDRNPSQAWEQQKSVIHLQGVSLDRAASVDQLPSALATPNVSPAASDDAHHESQLPRQLSETAGRREIEWVDWLDEYTKLKEAKLRSEKEELEKKRQEEEEAEVSMELEVLPLSQAATTPTTATFNDFNAQPTLSRSSESPTSRLSHNLSASFGLPDAKQGHRPRRPSEMPRFTARQEPLMRRSSSNALLPSGFEGSSGSASPVDRRSSFILDKNRTLSLSPINSRLASSGSQSSSNVNSSHNNFSSAGNHKKRRNLGGKIEAWWGAVKSGFSSNAPPSLMSVSSAQTPLSTSVGPSHGRKQMGARSKYEVEYQQQQQQQSGQAQQPFKSTNREASDLHSIFGNQTFGSPHFRSSTMQAASPSPAETKPINVLRAASSTQNLRLSSRGDDDVALASSEGPSLQSDQSSTGTAHAIPAPMILSPEQLNSEENTTSTSPKIMTPADEQDQLQSMLPKSKPVKKASHLSLHLRHGQSAFDAQPFEDLATATTSSDKKQHLPTSAPPGGISSSVIQVDETLSSAPVNSTTKGNLKILSDAWKPEVESRKVEGKVNSDSNASSVLNRGRSSQRKAKAERLDTSRASSKDMTMNSIRQHIHNRLTASKEAFDRELKKVIYSINLYVEETMQEELTADISDRRMGEDRGEVEEEEEDDDDEEETKEVVQESEMERDSELISSLGMMNLGEVSTKSGLKSSLSDGLHQGNRFKGDIDADETPQPNAEDATEAPTPRSRRITSGIASEGQEYALSMPSTHRKSSASALMPTRSVSRSTTLSRRSTKYNETTLSASRSTSRSHSPMPGTSNYHGGASVNDSPNYSPARRLRQLEAEDAPLEPFMAALQDLVSIAMEVYDTSIHTLTLNPGTCSEIISQVQAIGRRWDENPQWDGRGWYVQLLLAVAGLSRVVEWWEAEKGFWNFQDEYENGDKEDTEPIRFIFGNSNNAAGMFNLVGEGGNDYGGDPLSSARSAISNSPTRSRQMTVNQIMSYTPSQHSSAHSSPALEPWDRRVVSEGDRSKMNIVAAATATSTNSNLETKGESITLSAEKAIDRDSQNVVMELSVMGERFLYVSPAWRKVIGTDPVDILDLPIQDVLAPGDSSTFAQATDQLQANDAHTVEVAFRLQVKPSLEMETSDTNLTYYQEMEGKGMLMHDRQSAMPSHTMWVFKPVGAPEPEGDLSPGPQKPAAGAGEPPVVIEAREATTATINPIVISTEPLLCRICERDVPTWFFEKHSEICNEIHRLEMEISEYNEGLTELRRTTKSIIEGIEDINRTDTLEYRSISLSTPAATMGPPSALEVANRSISPRHPNPAAIRKTHLRALEGLMDILRIAATISTPAVKDDTASDPIEKQRLLSPGSDSKIIQVKNWKKLTFEDAALDLLASDVEIAIQKKLSAVNRNLNTIVYVETVRMEWEGRVEAALADLREESGSEEGSNASSVGEIGNEKTIDEGEATEEESTSAFENEAKDNKGIEDVEEKGAAAVLFETYEPDSARTASTSLSAHREIPGGTKEEDIPGVENQLGGSILDNVSPIPIPASQGSVSIRNPRQRRMTRDISSTSSLGLESVKSSLPHGGLHVDTQSATAALMSKATKIKRDSLLSGESRGQSSTPPISPRHSPAELHSIRTTKDRKLSMSHRAGGGGGGGLYSPHLSGMTPLSPRIPPAAPSSRPTASSIKDFDIIKPISKGAFGSVFLAKKHTTGDYYAIKVLKKSDMISKNQITNVKAERMILMTQTQSPFVVKLFFTFQSAEYLYLVMEYLPGGDCASLCKALGTLPEDWAKQYLAEVVNGLELLHSKGVVHRDMKPDNLLIDQKGHLKLTDFGLSKIGLLGRQNRQQLGGGINTSGDKGAAGIATTPTSAGASSQQQHGKKDSISSTTTSSSVLTGNNSNPATSPQGSKWPSNASSNRVPETPLSLSIAQSQNFFVGAAPISARGRLVSASTDASDSSGSESPMAMARGAKPVPVVAATNLMDSPSNIFGSHMMIDSHPSNAAFSTSSGSGAQLKKFVGTPDYLAPESILGLGMDDAAVDWWALGVILYEFLYGFPPFHADTPERVFDNILSRNIDWHEDDLEEDQISPIARDLMERLMCTDRKHRLGAGDNGATEIKNHAFFKGIDWDNLTKEEGPFVPQIADVESTDYFDLRGAVYQEFNTEHQQQQHNEEVQKQAQSISSAHHREFAKALEGKRSIEPSRPPSRYRMRLDRNKIIEGSSGGDDFGSFSYKNLPVLKQANDELIKKMRGEQLNNTSNPTPDQHHHHHHHHHHNRHRSISGKVSTPGAFPYRNSNILSPSSNIGPPSPSTSVSSQSSVPSKSTAPTSPSGIPSAGVHQMPSLHHHLSGQSGGSGQQQHRRRPSEMSSNAGGSNSGVAGSPMAASNLANAALMERKRSLLNESDGGSRRSSMPSRLQKESSGLVSDKIASQALPLRDSTLSSSNSLTAPVDEIKDESIAEGNTNSTSSEMKCLVAEDNPISLKMIEHVLTKLGCHVISVRNGAEALRLAMGETKFALLFIDATLPIVNGQDVARMIKSTRNINSLTPIVALTTFDATSLVDLTGNVFDAGLVKPIEKADVCNLLPRLGFRPLLASTNSRSASGSGPMESSSIHPVEQGQVLQS